LVNMMWFASNAVGGVKLQVAAADVARAEQLLARRQRGRHVDDYGLENPQRSGQAASDEDEADGEPGPGASSADELVNRAWRAAVFGLVLCPPLLHFWSLCLLAEAFTRQTPVSSSHRAKMAGALAIDVAVLLLVGSIYPMWNLLLR
jgi:hypothetical protein